MRITGPEELIAAVPHVLGFIPTDSLIVFPAGDSAQRPIARVDMPDPHEVAATIAQLAHTYHRNPGPVVLIAYSDDPTHAEQIVTDLTTALEDGCPVIDAFMVDGNGVRENATGQTFTVTEQVTDATAIQFIGSGRNTIAASREALREELEAGDTAAVQAHLIEAMKHVLGHSTKAEGEWALDTVRVAITTGFPFNDDEAARLLVGLGNNEIRDQVLALLNRTTAAAHVTIVSDLVRRAPQTHRLPAAVWLAIAAWQAGNGALAWTALDVADAPETYTLAQIIREVLDNALPPSVWDGVTATA